MKQENAIVVTNGNLTSIRGKTAHGLIRGSKRFKVLGLIESQHAGKDAGEVLDGIKRNIPIYASIDECLKNTSEKIKYCIVGAAFPGGKLPESWRPFINTALDKGISVVCGLHSYLNDDPDFLSRAKKAGVDLVDIRKPKPANQLQFWTGDIIRKNIRTIAVLGTDCAIGKRTTTKFLVEECLKSGINAEMIYTGQTGWMQGYDHGFVFDCTPNDFVSGELEKAILECYDAKNPDVMLLEGQSALMNPTGPCGAEFLLSGNAKGVVLQHVPFRKYFEGTDDIKCKIPDVQDAIKLISFYGSKVLAITLNGEGGTKEELIQYQKELQKKLDIPVIRPLEEGVSAIVPLVKAFISVPV